METKTETESRAPLFVFLGIVGLSLVFFFVFTKGGFVSGDSKPAAQPVDPSGSDRAGGVAGATTGVPGSDLGEEIGGGGKRSSESGGAAGQAPETSPAKVNVPRLSPELGALYAKAPGAVQELVAAAIAGKLNVHLAKAPMPPAEVALLETLFESGAWSIPSSESPVLLGQFGEKFRWKLPINAGSSSEEPASLYVDLIREPDGDGWRLADVRIPPRLVRAAMSAAKARGDAPDAGAIRGESDSMMVAEAFMTAVARKDYEEAIGMSDLDSITREKVAGLFIIFDEGRYRLRNEKGLMATVSTNDAAWIVGRIQSGAGLEPSDFGVELGYSEAAGWKVKGLHFSKLLATFAAASTPEGVPYTPIVENPSGGESLVLYFGYDEDMLHLRAQHQLSIVSALLKGDTKKSIRISGHADALGSENYNDNLSERRAIAVRDLLVQLGVDPGQIVTEGFGESKPLAENVRPDGSDDPEGRSKNRRTEIFLDF